MATHDSLTFFDHYQSSILGEWFAKPEFQLLPYEVLFNLLLSNNILCSKLDFTFYSYKKDPELKAIKYKSELKELIRIKKIIPIDIGSYNIRTLSKTRKLFKPEILFQQYNVIISF